MASSPQPVVAFVARLFGAFPLIVSFLALNAWTDNLWVVALGGIVVGALIHFALGYLFAMSTLTYVYSKGSEGGWQVAALLLLCVAIGAATGIVVGLSHGWGWLGAVGGGLIGLVWWGVTIRHLANIARSS
ncbi:hypothetical protein ACIBG8_03325 [Nonomuraea sp. NPDC050556]|uniref:hypothetical protein n=1 Tax=Nonomuraea sp. NPDC050556 TaxID=3364369 RepID=UPI0037A8FEDE